MKRATKRCSRPGCYETAGPSGYCPIDSAKQERARRRTTPTKRARTTEVRNHRKTAVLDHIEQHGDYCLGDADHPPHHCTDLVADDPVPIARGGDPLQPLHVMCRSANSRKGAR